MVRLPQRVQLHVSTGAGHPPDFQVSGMLGPRTTSAGGPNEFVQSEDLLLVAMPGAPSSFLLLLVRHLLLEAMHLFLLGKATGKLLNLKRRHWLTSARKSALPAQEKKKSSALGKDATV